MTSPRLAAATRHAEDRADAGPDHVGVEEVRAADRDHGDAPTASAERRIAPRLPGFSTSSVMTTSGAGERARSSRRVDGVATTRTIPSARSPYARRAKARSLTSARAAAGNRSMRSTARRPSSESTSEPADERLDDLDAGLDRPQRFARAVHERPPGRLALAPLAERQGGTHSRVRRAVDRRPAALGPLRHRSMPPSWPFGGRGASVRRRAHRD